MEELKPCPFCGSGGAGIVRAKAIFDYVLGFMVLCPDCGGTVGFNTDTEFTAFTDFSTEQEAIDMWNTRAERTCKFKPFKNQRSKLISEGVCSECSSYMHSEMLYCPNCGAKAVS